MVDAARLSTFVAKAWDEEIVPTLVEYIKIPNKSPSFDPKWQEHGYMDQAVTMFEGWAKKKIAGMPGATLEVVRLPGRTPLILIEVPGEGKRRSFSTAIWTSSRRWSAGSMDSDRGCR